MDHEFSIHLPEKVLTPLQGLSFEITQEIDFLCDVFSDRLEHLQQVVLAWLEYRLQHPCSLRLGHRLLKLPDAVPVRQEKQRFGLVDVLAEEEDYGVYCLRITPGQAIPSHYHRVMQEDELILDEGLLQGGCVVERFARRHWEKGEVHDYMNPTPFERSILCVDRPRFQPDDEIVV